LCEAAVVNGQNFGDKSMSRLVLLPDVLSRLTGSHPVDGRDSVSQVVEVGREVFAFSTPGCLLYPCQLSLLSSKASRPLGRAGVGTQREGKKKLPLVNEKVLDHTGHILKLTS